MDVHLIDIILAAFKLHPSPCAIVSTTAFETKWQDYRDRSDSNAEGSIRSENLHEELRAGAECVSALNEATVWTNQAWDELLGSNRSGEKRSRSDSLGNLCQDKALDEEAIKMLAEAMKNKWWKQRTPLRLANLNIEALVLPDSHILLTSSPTREVHAECSVSISTTSLAFPAPLLSPLEFAKSHVPFDMIEAEAHRMQAIEQRDVYATLSVFSPVGMFRTDKEGNVTHANQRWYELSGHPITLHPRSWLDSVHDEHRAYVEHVWDVATGKNRRMMTQEEPNSSEEKSIEFRYKESNWVKAELRPFQIDGAFAGFVGAISCLQRQKKLELENVHVLEKRADDANELRRQQELFVDFASHELRNPLSGVWQNAEVVLGSLEHINDVFQDMRMGRIPDDAGFEELMSEMEENIDGLESIILCASHQQRIADDILNVSKLNMNLLSINLIPFELAEKVKDVMKMFEIECAQKQIAFTLDVHESMKDVSIVADPDRIAQILINFLSNSIKCVSDCDDQSIAIHVERSDIAPPLSPDSMTVGKSPQQLAPDHTWMIISCQDSGKGMSAENLQKIFGKWSQSFPQSEQYSGTGLGLHISKQLVELHGGWIQVESTEGVGSTFRFGIPTTIALNIPELHNSSNVSAPWFTGPRRSSTVLTSKLIHVLVVEDNIINQKTLKRQLEGQNKFRVSIANHGDEAIALIKSDPSIVIGLCDISMPVKDGLTMVIELRELEKLGVISPLRLIAVTGTARDSHILNYREKGFDDVSIKPYKFSELLAQMEKALAQPSTRSTCPVSSQFT